MTVEFFLLKQVPKPFQEGVLLFTSKDEKTSFKECEHMGCTALQCTENYRIVYNHKVLEFKANRLIQDHTVFIIMNNVVIGSKFVRCKLGQSFKDSK